MRAIANKDVLAGLLLIAFAALFAWQSRAMPLGTAMRMGPGYFPLLLSGLLGLLGLATLVNGFRKSGQAPSGTAWRAVLVLTSAVVFFGFALRPLGFVPTLAITVFAATLASEAFRLRTALSITATLTTFCWVVFILGLRLPLPPFGPWLGAG